MKFLIVFSLFMTTSAYADIHESKVKSEESILMQDLEKSVDQKQQKALALITLISNRLGDDNHEAKYAHLGLAARLQSIREERRDMSGDYASLQDTSKGLDMLLLDLHASLK